MTNIVRLRREAETYIVEYDWTTYRFLLSDGSTIDVAAVQDDSWLRAEVLKIANPKTTGRTTKTTADAYEVIICGVAEIKPSS